MRIKKYFKYFVTVIITLFVIGHVDIITNLLLLNFADIEWNACWEDDIAFIFILLWVSVIACNRLFKVDYKISYCHWILLILIDGLYIYYRFFSHAIYIVSMYLIDEITYLDVILGWSTFLILLSQIKRIRHCIFNFVNKLLKRKSSKTDTIENTKNYNDAPIIYEEQDELGFVEDAKSFVEQLEQYDRRYASTIGINAPWGGGKTSFINLIKQQLNKDKYIYVDFNPRKSKDISTIRMDFMSVLGSKLSDYHSAAFLSFSGYIQTLDLDNSWWGIIKSSISFIFSEENLKNKIEKIVESTGKRVVVFIDDFDRLNKDEILEVLKVTDFNMSIPNVIFIIAYDGIQINHIFEKAPDYIRKYINYEYVFKPLRDRCSDKLRNAILVGMDKIIQDHTLRIILNHIAAFRDIKKFIFFVENKMTSEIRTNVYLPDFILLQLISFLYHQEYEAVRKRDIIVSEVSKYQTFYKLADEKIKKVLTEYKSIDILNELFKFNAEKIKIVNCYAYKRICKEASFFSYFPESKIDSGVGVEEEFLFNKPIVNVYERIKLNYNNHIFIYEEIILHFSDIITYLLEEKMIRYIILLMIFNSDKYEYNEIFHSQYVECMKNENRYMKSCVETAIQQCVDNGIAIKVTTEKEVSIKFIK